MHAVAKTAKINDNVVKLSLIIKAGENADTELDGDNPFEAGLNIVKPKSEVLKSKVPKSKVPKSRLGLTQ